MIIHEGLEARAGRAQHFITAMVYHVVPEKGKLMSLPLGPIFCDAVVLLSVVQVLMCDTCDQRII